MSNPIKRAPLAATLPLVSLLVLAAASPVLAQTATKTGGTKAPASKDLSKAVEQTGKQPAKPQTNSDQAGPVALDATGPATTEANLPPPPTQVAARNWSKADARALLEQVKLANHYGLVPSAYNPTGLQSAIDGGDQAQLTQVATASFLKLARHLRDGATPKAAKIEWFVKDDDAYTHTDDLLLAQATEQHDVAGALASLEPTHADYKALKAELAKTPAAETAKIGLIRTNLERWRWLPRDLGQRYIFVNVPEYTAQLADSGKLLRTHRVIVGNAKTPTPQLNVNAKGVFLNPVWYLPQSIIDEGVGALIRNNPAQAKARGYTWTKSGNKLYVQQKASVDNSLGMMKMDMPNDHAIFLHDTPAKNLFNTTNRAYSHGCIRTDRAVEFAAFMAIYYGGKTTDELKEIIYSGETKQIPFPEQIPVYINYFTARVEGGQFKKFTDIYGRDRPVLASMGYKAPAAATPAKKPAAKKKG